MRSKLAIAALSAAVAACATPQTDLADRGMASVNVPVVTTADYVFDAVAPGGTLAPGEAARLDGWFQGLGLGYGDTVYVDGGYSPVIRSQIASVAGRYGMLVTAGAPATEGLVRPGTARVVVARRRAEVPGCPNWSRPSTPDMFNRSMSNFGCGVNSNIAAMVANPEDLIHGRDTVGASDAAVAARAVQMYRSAPPTGTKGLPDTSAKGGK